MKAKQIVRKTSNEALIKGAQYLASLYPSGNELAAATLDEMALRLAQAARELRNAEDLILQMDGGWAHRVTQRYADMEKFLLREMRPD